MDAAVAEAFSTVQAARDALGSDDPRWATTKQFLGDCMQRLRQPDLGSKPRLPARRRDFVGTQATDARRLPREAAFTAMEALLAIAWPSLNNADRQARKRQRQLVALDACAGRSSASSSRMHIT